MFQATYISHYNSVIVGDEKMKTLKIALASAAVIGIVLTLTAGLSLAYYINTPYQHTNSYASEAEGKDWWNEMQEHMEARWTGIEDEEWFNDMTQYMEEHWNEVQNQEWFNQMLQYMEEHGYHPYGFENFEGTYGPRGYGRGFGCWGW